MVTIGKLTPDVTLDGTEEFPLEDSSGTKNIPLGSGSTSVTTNVSIAEYAKRYLEDSGEVSIAEITAVNMTTDGNVTAGGDIYTTAWTDYSASSTIVGWSSFSTKVIRYKKVGKLVYVGFNLYGTSDSPDTSFTLPYTAANTGVHFGSLLWSAIDNGTTITQACRFFVTAGSSTVNCYTDMASGAWTASGTKYISGQFWYEAA